MSNDKLIISMSEIIPLIKEAVSNGRQAEMTVTGNSMEPLLKDRISSVRLAEATDIKKGDIVLFLRSDGHYVLHRITAVHNGLYDIAGDNLASTDKNIAGSDIIAKVVAYSRSGKCWKKSDTVYRAILPIIKKTSYYIHKIKRKLIKSRSA